MSKKDDDIIKVKFNNKKNNTINSTSANNKKNNKKASAWKIISAVMAALIGFAIAYYFSYGSENSTLVCARSGQNSDEEYTLKFKNERYSSSKVKFTYYLEDIAKMNNMGVDDLNLGNSCTSLNNYDNKNINYTNCKEEKKNNKYYVYADVEFVLFKNLNGDIKEYKKGLEQGGFSCK